MHCRNDLNVFLRRLPDRTGKVSNKQKNIPRAAFLGAEEMVGEVSEGSVTSTSLSVDTDRCPRNLDISFFVFYIFVIPGDLSGPGTGRPGHPQPERTASPLPGLSLSFTPDSIKPLRLNDLLSFEFRYFIHGKMYQSTERAGTVDLVTNGPGFELICRKMPNIPAGTTGIFHPDLTSFRFFVLTHDNHLYLSSVFTHW